ncbi:hypothetical protein Cme02nite_26990 [Catellatospora methionotrophica]|uniref:Uncharacterized protein n=1 Tax=Catellatospora methionotrophica TaxID=121620 RepID=A0A8J3L4N5_9ACTN|nr:hypothetical protein [Catellatospora methionotrophica]GIG14367.1 hypothetical protein Cme02nite_26990 [Catellatospora methionotrophica]
MAIIVALAGIGGGVAALVTYNEATKIDRSNPKVVLDEYLRAALITKDEVGVNLHVCGNPAGLVPITILREEFDRRERDFGVVVLVTWGAITGAVNEEESTVTTTLTISGRKDGAVISKRSEVWRFGLVSEDGWRVCAAERVAEPTPSASASP